MTPRQFGWRLRRLRLARALSPAALAARARCSGEYIRRLEAGDYDPTLGMLQRLARALGVTLQELLFGE